MPRAPARFHSGRWLSSSPGRRLPRVSTPGVQDLRQRANARIDRRARQPDRGDGLGSEDAGPGRDVGPARVADQHGPV